MIFQSTHPVGGGTTGQRISKASVIFQSTHPVGGGTVELETDTAQTRFQSTHPVGGGTPGIWESLTSDPISIHPPRGGWDY